MANLRFSFFQSFEKALADVPPEDFKATVMAMCAYAFRGEEPEGMSVLQKAVFEMARPLIDKGKASAENGAEGGRPKNENLDDNQVSKEKPRKKSGYPPSKEKEKEMEEERGLGDGGGKGYGEGTGGGCNTSCTEPAGRPAPEPEAATEALILNDGTEWRPTATQYAEFARLYPSADIMAEFRNMRAWCMSNPSKRKTRGGVMRFANSWLSRTQNRGRDAPAKEKFNPLAYTLSQIGQEGG